MQDQKWLLLPTLPMISYRVPQAATATCWYCHHITRVSAPLSTIVTLFPAQAAICNHPNHSKCPPKTTTATAKCCPRHPTPTVKHSPPSRQPVPTASERVGECERGRSPTCISIHSLTEHLNLTRSPGTTWDHSGEQGCVELIPKSTHLLTRHSSLRHRTSPHQDPRG